ncbi:MAG: MAPEG family protein [Rhodothalassiaceae bacterium]
MTTELFYLLLSLGLLVLLHLIEVFHTLLALGPVRALSGVARMNLPDWRVRLMNTVTNLTQNLVIFAGLVLTATLLGVSTQLTVIGAAMFFYARVVHALVYVFRVPFMRAPAYLTGLAGCILIAVELL